MGNVLDRNEKPLIAMILPQPVMGYIRSITNVLELRDGAFCPPHAQVYPQIPNLKYLN